jgi:hypothetical protein
MNIYTPVLRHPQGMNELAIAELLALQSGVISRPQVLAAGGCDHDIARHLRRRIWARIHDGVYVDHTGEPSWKQRAWAAVLYYWPARPGRRLRPDGPRRSSHWCEAPVHAGRGCTRRADFENQAQMNLCPPRARVEHALLTVASRSQSEDVSVGVLADACQGRHTTPGRLLAALRQRQKLPRRRLLLSVLEDVTSGAYSVLERRYLLRVERPHGLPTGVRQRKVRTGRRVHYRDVDYVDLATIVELDGRIGHEAMSDRWADLERDLDAAVRGALTLRIGWSQVLDPCRLAAAVVRILMARGWDGSPRPCRPDCAVAEVCADLPPSAA